MNTRWTKVFVASVLCALMIATLIPQTVFRGSLFAEETEEVVTQAEEIKEVSQIDAGGAGESSAETEPETASKAQATNEAKSTKEVASETAAPENEATSEEATSAEATSAEATSEEATSPEATSEEATSEKASSEEKTPTEAVTEEATSEDKTEEVTKESKEEVTEETKEEAETSRSKKSRAASDEDDSQPYFDIYWTTGLPTTSVVETDAAGHAIEILDIPKQDQPSASRDLPYVTAMVEFSLGRSVPSNIKAGEIKIAIPKNIFKQWDWDDDGVKEDESRNLIVGVGEKPTETGKEFWYYYATKGSDGKYTEDKNGDYLIIENYQAFGQNDINKQFACTISYPYIPSRVDARDKFELKAEYIVETPGAEVRKNNDTLTVSVETGTTLARVSKSFISQGNTLQKYMEWNDDWGDFADTGLTGDKDKDYVYIPTRVTVTLTGKEQGQAPTRPFYLWISDEEPGVAWDDSASSGKSWDGNGKGTVVAYSGWGNSTFYTKNKMIEAEVEDSTIGGTRKAFTLTDYDTPLNNYGGVQISAEHYPSEYNDRLKNSYFSGPSSSSVLADTNVLVAYPKDYWQEVVEGGDPDMALTNGVTVSMRQYGDDEVEEKTGRTFTRDQVVKFRYYPGIWTITKFDEVGGGYSSYSSYPYYYDKDGNGNSYRGQSLVKGESEEDMPGSDMTKPRASIQGGKWMIEHDIPVDLYSFYIGDPRLEGRLALWGLTKDEPEIDKNPVEMPVDEYYDVYGKNEYTLEIMDDQIYLDTYLLQPGDYEMISSRYVSTREYFFDVETESFRTIADLKRAYPEDEDVQAMEASKPNVYARFEYGGDWVLVEEAAEQYATYGEGANNVTNLPAGTYEVKYEFKSKAAGINPEVYVNVRLNPTENVKRILAEQDGEPRLTDIASFGLRDKNGRQLNLNPESTISGWYKEDVMRHDQEGGHGLPEGSYLSHARAYQYLSGYDSDTNFSKMASGSRDDNANHISYRTYSLQSAQTMRIKTTSPAQTLANMEEMGVSYGQKEVIFYDVIPKGGTLEPRNITVTYRDSLYRSYAADFTYETTPNYLDTGATLLEIKAKLPESAPADFAQNYNPSSEILDLTTRVDASIPVAYSWEDLALLVPASEGNASRRSVTNYGAVYVPDSNDGWPDDPTASGGKANRPFLPNPDPEGFLGDLHPGGDPDAKDTYYDTDVSTFNIAQASITGYSKYVKADTESSFRTDSAVEPDEGYIYRLQYVLERNTQAKNIVIYDVLEEAWVEDAFLTGEFKDKFDLTGRYWMGTFDKVDISRAQNLGIDVKVYYSTYDKQEMQEHLDDYTGAGGDVSEYADLTNPTYWTASTPAALERMSAADKAKITAIAFDCSKKRNGEPFIFQYEEDGSSVLQLYIHMKAPSEDEVEEGHDGKGSYVDPENVYAYNNSFLASQTSPDGNEWTANGARMSDGTTVRIAEPRPEIYKKVEDADEAAGATSSVDILAENAVKLDDRGEVFKYTINSKVPTLGTAANGRDEVNTFTLYDQLVDELIVTRPERVKITIGKYEGNDTFFGFDPDAPYNGHKGYIRSWTGERDKETGARIFEEAYFDSLDKESIPEGFEYTISKYTGQYEYSAVSLKLFYESEDDTIWGPGPYVEGGFNRVREFEGENICIEFYAKIRDGASLGAYEDEKVPNTAGYTIPNHQGMTSNTVYISPPDEETPEPEKKVALVDDDGKVGELGDHQDMVSLDQKIHYSIKGTLPYEHNSLNIKDVLEPVLKLDRESVKLNFKGKVTVNEFTMEEVISRYSDGTPRYDYSDISYDEVEYDEDGNPTNVPYLMEEEYTPVLDEDGSIVTKQIDIDRTFDADQIQYLFGSAYKIGDDNDSLEIYFDNNFINWVGDAFIFAKVEKTIVVDDEGNETVRWDTDYGEYGRESIRWIPDFSLAGVDVTISFDASIREVADLEPYKVNDVITIPNTVLYRFGNNVDIETEPVTVTPPDISKTVNGKTHVDLANWDEVFTYKIAGFMPAAKEDETVTSAVFTDTLEDVLEFTDKADTTITIGGEEADPALVKTKDQTLTADLTSLAQENQGKLVVITFKAKIKKGVKIEDLADYVVDTSEAQIPNEAALKVKIDDKPETELKTKPVTVTPPPIEKRVNEKYHENLKKTEEVFTYSIKTWVPVADNNDEKATSFKIIDTLEPVLEFTENEATTISIDGVELTPQEVKEQTVRGGQKLTVSLTEKQISKNPKKLVEVTFKAKIRAGADLTKYVVDGSPLIPNDSSYKINNDAEVVSNVVTVTPPDVNKTVNDSVSAELESFDEVFTYKITGLVPTAKKGEEITKFTLSDKLQPVLEFTKNDSTVLKLNGKELKADTYVKREGKTITVTIADKALLKANAGKYAEISFKAKITDGADLSEYIVEGSKPEVPNKATLQFDINGKPQTALESEPVTVTPPPIEKKVNGKYHEGLASKTEVFEYTVKTIIPKADDVTKFVVDDTLEPVLEFADGSASAKIGGKELAGADIKIKGQTITLTLSKDEVQANKGKVLVLAFKSNIRENSDLSPYIQGGLPLVPNMARYIINDDPGRSQDSNVVTVTPPTINKKVNGKEREELFDRDQIFTYTLDTIIPNDAVKLTFTDKIEPVLEFATGAEEVIVSIDGKAVKADVKIKDQLITVNVGKDVLAGNGGKEIAVDFTAKITKGADLSAYINNEVPNEATLIINDDPARTYKSEPVIVVPPDENEPPIDKRVNGKMHEDLASSNEKFTYTVRTAIPANAEKFVVSDTIEDVLTFTGEDKVSVSIGETKLSGADVASLVKIDGQTISLTIGKEMLEAYKGELVVLRFDAVIKNGADLSKYLVNGKVLIPNVARYVIDDDPHRAKNSNVVTVTPPKDTPPYVGPPSDDGPPANDGPPSKYSPPRFVKTGDSTHWMIWVVIAGLAVIATTVTLIVRRRRHTK